MTRQVQKRFSTLFRLCASLTVISLALGPVCAYAMRQHQGGLEEPNQATDELARSLRSPDDALTALGAAANRATRALGLIPPPLPSAGGLEERPEPLRFEAKLIESLEQRAMPSRVGLPLLSEQPPAIVGTAEAGTPAARKPALSAAAVDAALATEGLVDITRSNIIRGRDIRAVTNTEASNGSFWQVGGRGGAEVRVQVSGSQILLGGFLHRKGSETIQVSIDGKSQGVISFRQNGNGFAKHDWKLAEGLTDGPHTVTLKVPFSGSRYLFVDTVQGIAPPLLPAQPTFSTAPAYTDQIPDPANGSFTATWTVGNTGGQPASVNLEAKITPSGVTDPNATKTFIYFVRVNPGGGTFSQLIQKASDIGGPGDYHVDFRVRDPLTLQVIGQEFLNKPLRIGPTTTDFTVSISTTTLVGNVYFRTVEKQGEIYKVIENFSPGSWQLPNTYQFDKPNKIVSISGAGFGGGASLQNDPAGYRDGLNRMKAQVQLEYNSFQNNPSSDPSGIKRSQLQSVIGVLDAAAREAVEAEFKVVSEDDTHRVLEKETAAQRIRVELQFLVVPAPNPERVGVTEHIIDKATNRETIITQKLIDVEGDRLGNPLLEYQKTPDHEIYQGAKFIDPQTQVLAAQFLKDVRARQLQNGGKATRTFDDQGNLTSYMASTSDGKWRLRFSEFKFVTYSYPWGPVKDVTSVKADVIDPATGNTVQSVNLEPGFLDSLYHSAGSDSRPITHLVVNSLQTRLVILLRDGIVVDDQQGHPMQDTMVQVYNLQTGTKAVEPFRVESRFLASVEPAPGGGFRFIYVFPGSDGQPPIRMFQDFDENGKPLNPAPLLPVAFDPTKDFTVSISTTTLIGNVYFRLIEKSGEIYSIWDNIYPGAWQLPRQTFQFSRTGQYVYDEMGVPHSLQTDPAGYRQALADMESYIKKLVLPVFQNNPAADSDGMKRAELQGVIDVIDAAIQEVPATPPPVAGAEELTRNPEAARLNREGTTFFGQRKYPEAEVKFRGALKVDPRYSLAWFNLGNVASTYFEQLSKAGGQPEEAEEPLQEAIESYEKARELAPADHNVVFRANKNLGALYLVADRLEDSIQASTNASTAVLGDAAVWSNLSLAYQERGARFGQATDLSRALEAAQRATRIDPASSDYLTRLGSVYLAREEYSRALTVLEMALQLDSTNVEALLFQSQAHFYLRNFSQAISSARQAAQKRSPMHPVSQNAWAVITTSQLEMEKAKESAGSSSSGGFGQQLNAVENLHTAWNLIWRQTNLVWRQTVLIRRRTPPLLPVDPDGNSPIGETGMRVGDMVFILTGSRTASEAELNQTVIADRLRLVGGITVAIYRVWRQRGSPEADVGAVVREVHVDEGSYYARRLEDADLRKVISRTFDVLLKGPTRTGLEEAKEASAVVVSFDPAASVGLEENGFRTWAVAETLTDAKRMVQSGVDPQTIVGIVGWAGLEEQDYRRVNAGIQMFIPADPTTSGFHQAVLSHISRLNPQAKVIAVFDEKSLAGGLEELGIPGVRISRVLERRSQAQSALAVMD